MSLDADEPDRLAAHPPVPHGYAKEGRRRVILMTPAMAGVGGMAAFFTIVALLVVLPTATYNPPVGDNWLPLSDAATRGRNVYLANGCVYCHSGFSRPQDVEEGLYYLYPRVSTPGDFPAIGQSPNLFGSQRTGPDLSQEGGFHPDGWHEAHYANPRYTIPLSIMPRFNFFSDEELDDLIAFNQSAGGKEALVRYATVTVGNKLMRINGGMLDPAKAFPELADELGEAIESDGQPSDASPWGMPWMAVWHMNSFDRGYWLTDNPLKVTDDNLLRGKETYLQRCAGCHGVNGTGDGPAAQFLAPKPFNFADAEEMNGTGASSGQMYHRILTAGPGTAMESFGTRLSVSDIWRVTMFLRTIPNGGLQEPLPTVEMYDDWRPPDSMLRYIEDNPVSEQSAGLQQEPAQTQFQSGARWLAPGMDNDDEILVGGKLPMTLERLGAEIERTYFTKLEDIYTDAQSRGDRLPPREEVFSLEGVEFHGPA